MNNDMQQLIIDLADDYARGAGRDVPASEVREAIRADAMAALAATERNLDVELDLLLRGALDQSRDQRAKSLKRDLDWILDGFKEDGAYIDPLLDLAYPLGRADGATKTLRLWTREDFQTVIITRYRVAAEVTEAASGFDLSASRAITVMDALGITLFGEAARQVVGA